MLQNPPKKSPIPPPTARGSPLGEDDDKCITDEDWATSPRGGLMHCVVPEKIHTHRMEGHWKFLGGGGGGLES